MLCRSTILVDTTLLVLLNKRILLLAVSLAPPICSARQHRYLGMRPAEEASYILQSPCLDLTVWHIACGCLLLTLKGQATTVLLIC